MKSHHNLCDRVNITSVRRCIIYRVILSYLVIHVYEVDVTTVRMRVERRVNTFNILCRNKLGVTIWEAIAHHHHYYHHYH